MASEQWDEVVALFEQALQRTTTERERFVLDAAKENTALRDSVLALLRADARVHPLLASEPVRLGAAIQEAARPSLAGQRLGAYEIVQEIGHGGMATVYAATDARHNRRVALKVLDQHISSSLGPDRFLREIQIAARLTHPNIVPLHDSGEVNGQLFYVMPYVVGESLRARLVRDGPLPVAEALRLAGEVAEALDYAHRHGVVHRDVKPENILLSERHCLVVDFGIARAIQEAAGDRLTSQGLLLGTPAYMSPEQASGEREIDARSDVFSLGATLYEMLSGASPFSAPTLGATLARVLTASAPSVRQVRADVPASVDDLLQTALSKDRDARFQTAGVMATQLHKMSATLTTDRGRRLTKRSVLIAAVAALIVALGVAGMTWQRSRGRATAGSGAARQSVAVLPFSDEAADSANAYFASGIAEELLNALADVPGLKVASRTASFSLGSAATNPRDVARTLGVATILEGSVRRSQASVRVSARLVNAADGSVIWTASIDGVPGRVFEVQEQIARAIVDRMRLRLLPGESTLVRRRTTDPDAHNLVLRARQLARSNSRSRLLEAAQLLDQALALDSAYAETHAVLADVYESLAVFGDQSGLPGGAAMPSGEMLRRARVAAQRAVDLDPRSSAAHVALGFLLFRYDWDWSAAERELRRALELQPASALAHLRYSRYLRSMGRFDEARAHVDSAQKYDEQVQQSWGLSRGRVAYFARDYDRAIRESMVGFDTTLRLSAVWLAQAYASAGRYAQAESLLTHLPGDERSKRTTLAYIYAHTGRTREAHALLDESKGREGELTVHIAGVYAVLGDTTAAFAELDRAVLTHDPLVVDFKVNPWIDPLRRYPHFIALMQRLAFPP